MRISELARSSGLQVATVKYYLREGLLPAGQLTARTQAVYDDTHLQRLRLIRALVELAGLSIGEVAAVVTCLDNPPTSWHAVLGAAHSALPPRVEPLEPEKLTKSPAWRLLGSLGWQVHPRAPAVAQLDRAMTAAAAAGMAVDQQVLQVYARAAQDIADTDVAGVPTSSPEEATRHVVVGTLLYEPILLALRRLAQADASARRFAGSPAASAGD